MIVPILAYPSIMYFQSSSSFKLTRSLHVHERLCSKIDIYVYVIYRLPNKDQISIIYIYTSLLKSYNLLKNAVNDICIRCVRGTRR